MKKEIEICWKGDVSRFNLNRKKSMVGGYGEYHLLRLQLMLLLSVSYKKKISTKFLKTC